MARRAVLQDISATPYLMRGMSIVYEMKLAVSIGSSSINLNINDFNYGSNMGFFFYEF